MLLATVFHSNALAEKTETDPKVDRGAKALITKIRQSIPEGWSVSYKKEHQAIEVTRKKPVAGSREIPNADGAESKEVEHSRFRFRFLITPKLSQPSYERMLAENVETRKKLPQKLKELRRMGISHKGDSFLPDDGEEETAVEEYEALKKSIHSLPEYHFQGISLRWWRGFDAPDSFYPIGFLNEKTMKECHGVRSEVVKLLTPHVEKRRPEPKEK